MINKLIMKEKHYTLYHELHKTNILQRRVMRREKECVCERDEVSGYKLSLRVYIGK
jgi:hypothetical protein